MEYHPIAIPWRSHDTCRILGGCGSNLHAYNGAPGYEFVQKPCILGHEIAGIVVDVFDETDRYLLNQRESLNPFNTVGAVRFVEDPYL